MSTPLAGARTSACPDEADVAAYVDGALSPEAAGRLETHLADCGECLGLVGLLTREGTARDFEPVRADLIERVCSAAPAPEQRAKRYAPYLAMAASLLLAVAVLVNVTQRGAPESDQFAGEGAREVRKSAGNGRPLEVLYPRPGGTIPNGHLSFRWTAVPGSHYYEVRILNDAGDTIADQRVDGTQWQPESPLALRVGATYYLHIDAYLNEDRVVGSEHIQFRVVK